MNECFQRWKTGAWLHRNCCQLKTNQRWKHDILEYKYEPVINQLGSVLEPWNHDLQLLCGNRSVAAAGTSSLYFSPLPLAPGHSLDLATPTELPSILSGPVDGGDSLFSPQLPLCSAESPSTAEFHLVLGTDSAWSTATLASVQPLLLIPQSNISQQLKQPPWSNLKQTAPVGTAACSHLEGEAVCTEASAVSAICMNKQLWRVQLKLLCKHSPKYVLCCIIPSNKDSGTGIWLSVLLMLHGVQ